MATTSDPGYAALLHTEKLKSAVRTVAQRVGRISDNTNRVDVLEAQLSSVRRELKASRRSRKEASLHHRKDESRIAKLESELGELRAEQRQQIV